MQMSQRIPMMVTVDEPLDAMVARSNDYFPREKFEFEVSPPFQAVMIQT